MDLREPPADEAGVTYEFFAPFAHVEGRYEWCRIRSPTHGIVDAFILMGRTPVVVYVATDEGARYMAERYPECSTFRASELRIAERDGGRTVVGHLRSDDGPVREADMTLTAPANAQAEPVAYGGEGKPVWGSKRFTCWGVDLVLRGRADGDLTWEDGRAESLRGEKGIVTLGSFGRISPLGH